MQWTYKDAGVDVEAGYAAVSRIKEYAERTVTPGVLGGLGGFGGMFSLPGGYAEPVLVSGTDGVGTKLRLAFETGVHNTVGIDCVAMCVNDIACNGAKPLFFLDYIATGELLPEVAARIVEGISDGCIQAGCALIGGETAEMPGFYKPGEYDVAGFAVGIAEKARIIDGHSIAAGDVLLGVASSGVHSNGFSLVHKLLEAQGLTHDRYFDELGTTLGEALLTPTKIYVPVIARLTEQFAVKGMAHITGGGWIENIPRMLPPGLTAAVKKAPVPEIFRLLRQWGDIDEKEMYNTFNMGVGLVLAVAAEDADAVLHAIDEMDEKAYILGMVEKGDERIVIH